MGDNEPAPSPRGAPNPKRLSGKKLQELDAGGLRTPSAGESSDQQAQRSTNTSAPELLDQLRQVQSSASAAVATRSSDGNKATLAPSAAHRASVAVPVVDHSFAQRYQIGDELGKGAMGRVYRALSVADGSVVAVKQIQKSLLDQKALPSIKRELELLQTLNHKNIVRFIEYFDAKDSLYFVMEYVEGGSLHNMMKKFGLFPEPVLAIYMLQTLVALEYLHANQVIHRDIKGANLLLTKEGVWEWRMRVFNHAKEGDIGA